MRRDSVDIGVIAVPVEQAQNVCDSLVEGRVSGIVNFAPTRVTVPPRVKIQHVDLSMEFEQLTYHLSLASAERRSA